MMMVLTSAVTMTVHLPTIALVLDGGYFSLAPTVLQEQQLQRQQDIPLGAQVFELTMLPIVLEVFVIRAFQGQGGTGHSVSSMFLAWGGQLMSGK
jgi:hypothetical protein